MAGIKIGSAAMIEIGYAGENKTREIIFDAKEWMEKLPGCEPAIVGVRADGVEFTAPDVRKDEEEKTIIWTLTDGETIAGEGEAQLLWMDGERVAKRAIMVTTCRASLETEATVPGAPEPIWGRQAVEAMQRAEEAAAKAETARGSILHEKETAMMEIRGAVTSANDAAASAAEAVQKTQNAAMAAEEQSQAAENAAKNAQEDEEKAQQWAAEAQTYAGAAESAQSHAQGYAQTAQTASAKAETDAREARNASEIAENAAARAEEAAGSVEDGGYYEPSVSQTGMLTWRPSKDGMPFPDAVNIQGPRGLTGATGGTPQFDISRVENGTRVMITTPSVPNPGLPDTPGTVQSFTIPDGEEGKRGEPGTIPIIAEGDGNVIATEDSAASPVRGFTLYGKTTQNGTPTPSTPRPLVTVGADGDVTVSAKNGIPEGGNEHITIINQPRNMTAPAGTNAVFHVDAVGDGLTYQWTASVNGGGTWMNSSMVSATTSTLTLAAKAYMNGYMYRCQITDANGNTVTTDVATLTIGEPTAIENPVTVQTATIATPNGLPGVPVTSGGNYTDANGQQWVADTIEYDADDGTEKWTKRANTLVFDGSEDENWRVNGGRMQLNVKDVIFPNSASEMPAVMCDKFEAKTANQTYDEQVGISLQGFGGGSGSIFIRYGATADVAEWRNMLAEEPMMCIVALAEPIETQISAEETAQIAALKTYYPETTVYNEDGAHMEVKYVADTKNYIDKKIEAIAAAMIANI